MALYYTDGDRYAEIAFEGGEWKVYVDLTGQGSIAAHYIPYRAYKYRDSAHRFLRRLGYHRTDKLDEFGFEE